MNKNKELDTRKFHPLSICLGLASFLLSFFCLAISGLLTGIAGMVLGIKKKKEHRTAIGIAFSVVGILVSLFYLCMVIQTGLNPDTSMDYWLYQLIWGAM